MALLHLGRRQRGEHVELALVEAGIVGQHFAARKCHRLAAKAADLFQTADRAGQIAGRGAAYLVLGRTFGNVFCDELVEPVFERRQFHARFQRSADRQDADALEVEIARAHADGQLLVAHEDFVETAGSKAAEHARADIQRGQFLARDAGDGPIPGQRGGGDIILHDAALVFGEHGNAGLRRIVDRTACDLAEILVHERARFGRGDVACQHDGRVVRPVFVAEPVAHVVHAGAVEVGHRADYRMAIGVTFGEHVVEDLIENEAARLVVALALFVLHDAALVIELLLRHCAQQIAHAVAFQPQRAFQRGAGDGLEVVGAVEIGRAVVIGRAHFLQVLEIVVRRVLAAVEHQMLEQMGKPGLAFGLVL